MVADRGQEGKTEKNLLRERQAKGIKETNLINTGNKTVHILNKMHFYKATKRALSHSKKIDNQ